MLVDIASHIHAFKGTPELLIISNGYKKEFLKEALSITKYHDDLRHLVLGSIIFGVDVEFRDLDETGLKFILT